MLGDTKAATAGIKHACAWNADGEAYCWGGNAKGQIGDGSTTDALTPQRVRF
jgi:alpha-tubulin suppressor-like RCC1 family protein